MKQKVELLKTISRNSHSLHTLLLSLNFFMIFPYAWKIDRKLQNYLCVMKFLINRGELFSIDLLLS